MLVVIGWSAWRRVAGDSVERLARGCACEIIAGLNHVGKVTPRVGSRVPGDRAGAHGKVDVAACEQPSAVVRSGGSSRAPRWQIGDCGIVPGIGAWIVAPGFVRGSVAAARVNIVTQSHCHEAVVGKWVVCCHRPGIRGDSVHLDVKIGADGPACDAVDLAVKVHRRVEVRGNGVRR